MKIATGNRLNEFWEELKGVLVPKSKVLKTLEEIDANTNEENIAGATALKAVNNKLTFPDGSEFYLDTKDGERGFNTEATRGADTFVPFSKYEIKAYNTAAAKTSHGATATITIPQGVQIGLLICISTGWYNGNIGLRQDIPEGNGIKTISKVYQERVLGSACANIVSVYKCKFYPGETVNLYFADNNVTGYASGQLILLA